MMRPSAYAREVIDVQPVGGILKKDLPNKSGVQTYEGKYDALRADGTSDFRALIQTLCDNQAYFFQGLDEGQQRTLNDGLRTLLANLEGLDAQRAVVRSKAPCRSQKGTDISKGLWSFFYGKGTTIDDIVNGRHKEGSFCDESGAHKAVCSPISFLWSTVSALFTHQGSCNSLYQGSAIVALVGISIGLAVTNTSLAAGTAGALTPLLTTLFTRIVASLGTDRCGNFSGFNQLNLKSDLAERKEQVLTLIKEALNTSGNELSDEARQFVDDALERYFLGNMDSPSDDLCRLVDPSVLTPNELILCLGISMLTGYAAGPAVEVSPTSPSAIVFSILSLASQCSVCCGGYRCCQKPLPSSGGGSGANELLLGSSNETRL